MTPEICGLAQLSAFALYDPDLPFLRTSQDSLLLGTAEPYSETWPKQGLMQDGACWEHGMSKPPTKETGCGFWPTPAVSDSWFGDCSKQTVLDSIARGTRAARDQLAAVIISEGDGGGLNPTWVEWLMGWPTGWTDLKPLEMDRFQQWLEQFGDF